MGINSIIRKNPEHSIIYRNNIIRISTNVCSLEGFQSIHIDNIIEETKIMKLIKFIFPSS